MKLTLVTLLAMVAAASLSRRSTAELARRAAIRIRNHRGLEVAGTGGIAFLLGLVGAAAIGVLATMPWSPGGEPFLAADSPSVIGAALLERVLVTGFLFGLLGFYADLARDRTEEAGWRGVLGSLRAGRARPHAIRVVAGGLLGLIAAGPHLIPDLLVAAAIVAVGSHLLDGFDARPLRAIKISGLWLAVLLLAALAEPDPGLITPILVVAAALWPLAKGEAAERIVLGRVGTSALGAILGVLTIATVWPGVGRLLVLGILAGLTWLSRTQGFSSAVERTGPLRRLDALGRQPDPPARLEAADEAG